MGACEHFPIPEVVEWDSRRPADGVVECSDCRATVAFRVTGDWEKEEEEEEEEEEK